MVATQTIVKPIQRNTQLTIQKVADKPTQINYNGLSCPNCSNLLHDHLASFEVSQNIKSVKCITCDFVGTREGWIVSREVEVKIKTKR